MSAVIAAVLFVVGCFGWGFLEYVLHRFDGHGRRGRSLFSREHLQHHAVKDYFTPTWMKAIGTTPVVVVAAAFAAWLLGPLYGLSISAGFVAAYVFYEVFHHTLHIWPPRTRYGRWARKHHFSHHFSSAKMNHGVTSPIWDLVFGTYLPDHKLRVPKRFAMRWLVDERGELRPEYAQDYELVGSRIQEHDPDVDLVRGWGIEPSA
jgi:sterol desaturase/sphingolipid hydroxylase (fatty acid hydroxylase superfamily)